MTNFFGKRQVWNSFCLLAGAINWMKKSAKDCNFWQIQGVARRCRLFRLTMSNRLEKQKRGGCGILLPCAWSGDEVPLLKIIRCIMGLQRDVVYLCWPIAPSYIRVQMRGEGGSWGSQPMSTAVHITWHEAQINFGDLPPYLIYAVHTLWNLAVIVLICGLPCMSTQISPADVFSDVFRELIWRCSE